jgi:tripartite-type tricarboxylate transporter receptor subunit TctC
MPRIAASAPALVLATAGALALGCTPALAQKAEANYPTKPIRMIVPFVPGGGTDIVARGLAQKLYEQMGQTVVVDNRPGAGGTVGAETTVRATPDGYTIIMVSGSYGTNAALYKLPYDPINDIAPIVLVGESGFMVSLNPKVPVASIKELIAYAKANPGKLNYGSTGTGGITHLSTELFDLMAGTKMTHIPYKGTGGALSDLIGGQIQLIFGSLPSMVPQVKSGRLRGIGVTTAKRNPAVPDIPAIAETVPGYESVLWYGAWGPKALPQPIIRKLNAEFAKALTAPEVRERLSGEGIDIAGGPPDQLRDILKREIPKWIDVVKRANVKISS